MHPSRTPAPTWRTFLDRLPPDLRSSYEADPEVPGRLQTAWEEACQRWPGVLFDGDLEGAHLATVVAAGAVDPAGFRHLRLDQLFLTGAAGRGVEAAVREIEEAHFAQLRAGLRRIAGSDANADDVLQTLRRDLFVPREGQPAAIASFGGRADLRTWLRVSAVRLASRARERSDRERPDDVQKLAAAAGGVGGETSLVRAIQQRDFAQMVRDAIATLQDGDRLLLKQHYLDEQSIDALAEVHGAHRATIARRIERARAALRARLLAVMDERGYTPESRDSLIRLVLSDLHMTLGLGEKT